MGQNPCLGTAPAAQEGRVGPPRPPFPAVTCWARSPPLWPCTGTAAHTSGWLCTAGPCPPLSPLLDHHSSQATLQPSVGTRSCVLVFIALITESLWSARWLMICLCFSSGSRGSEDVGTASQTRSRQVHSGDRLCSRRLKSHGCVSLAGWETLGQEFLEI